MMLTVETPGYNLDFRTLYVLASMGEGFLARELIARLALCRSRHKS